MAGDLPKRDGLVTRALRLASSTSYFFQGAVAPKGCGRRPRTSRTQPARWVIAHRITADGQQLATLIPLEINFRNFTSPASKLPEPDRSSLRFIFALSPSSSGAHPNQLRGSAALNAQALIGAPPRRGASARGVILSPQRSSAIVIFPAIGVAATSLDATMALGCAWTFYMGLFR
ncbi:uncharacterized protein LAESUDRAFT_762149 [Laetiporus sulphureus 93-53]|uniref:Uncharacterized protein n=1 Tax=Laetiporus sulphureus 93-53 TaxID=1314785 RepID=A0A165CP29_9APHY|nr:uncharacterized protein LAESUDRAFT_762149 [Laetiporus sulphureus 93-53]KZT03159.1 hypothetical protein LAESUDRAFT_762149 [Laetiporus sulphureus 93-53]